jgi:spermidine synthase
LKKNNKKVIFLVVTTGVSSVVTQLLTIREFLAQFSGNEFVIAIILFNWLILGGAGAILANLYIRFFEVSISSLSRFSILLSSLPVLQILCIRLLRDTFFIYGSSIGFYPILAYTFFTIAPYTLLIGFVLPYSLYVLRKENPTFSGSYIYITDNLGDVSGGALFSFVLIYFATPMQALFLSGLPLLIAAFILFPGTSRYRPGVLSGTAVAFVILIIGMLLEPSSLSSHKGKPVYYSESRYGRIEVHQDQEQFTLFKDGIPVSSSQNLSKAEEAVHYPLSQIERVERVLMISADGGMLKELKKYKPGIVDYVEIDPKVTDVMFRFGMINKIPGLNIIHYDGRQFLSGTERIYDAIIISLPEPDTFQINRFYTDQFFSVVKKHLSPNGIFSFSFEGFDNYLAESQRQKISSIFNTVSNYFSQVLMLPGQRIFFLCTDFPIRTDIPKILTGKGINTEYISKYFYGNLSDLRIDHLNNQVDRTTPDNLDQSPRLIRLMFSQWFAKYSTSPVWFVAAFMLLLLLYLFRISKEEYVLFSTGFITMGSEILVIFAFQIFFGYIYLQIGIIVTVFLSGLLPGAWIGDRLKNQNYRKYALAYTDCIQIVLMVVFIAAIQYVGDRLPVAFFLGFGFLISLVCGFQFPAAFQLQGGDNRAASFSFSADLIGAACGVLITSIVLIPYHGIIWATLGLLCLKLSSLAVIVTRKI